MIRWVSSVFHGAPGDHQSPIGSSYDETRKSSVRGQSRAKRGNFLLKKTRFACTFVANDPPAARALPEEGDDVMPIDPSVADQYSTG